MPDEAACSLQAPALQAAPTVVPPTDSTIEGQTGQERAPALPTRRASSTAYRIKRISFLGEKVAILCQSVNGPCPILSIANFLSLTGALRLPHSQQIDADALTQLLAEFLLEKAPANLWVLDKLPALHAGLNVDPQFSGCNAFREGTEVMAAFGAELVHAWLPDPATEQEAYQILTQGPGAPGYEAAQAFILNNIESASTESHDALVLQQWFDAHPTYMTPYGLHSLQQSIQSGELRILFYNAHFSLLLKHFESDNLFCLVSDAGYAHAGDDVVWESLTTGEASVMLSSEFVPRDVLALSRQEDAFGRREEAVSEHGYEEDDAAFARTLQEEDDRRLARTLLDEDEARMAQREQQRRDREAQEAAHRMQQQSSRQPLQATSSAPVHLPIPTKSDKKNKKDCLIM
jgi:hypothetical protein